jgi:hypothetical protein
VSKLAVSLVLLCATAALVAAGASSAPRQAVSKWYWTRLACKQKLQPPGMNAPAGSGALILTTDHHGFHVAQAVCVGSGGQRTCAWPAGSGSRLYSAFTVYTRSELGGVVRSFTLNTQPGHGIPVPRKSTQPPLAYVSNFKLITTEASPARFTAIVGPIAAQLAQQQNAKGCGRHGG